jgi:putative transcriptional regulator
VVILNPIKHPSRRLVKRSVFFSLFIIPLLTATVLVQPVFGAESSGLGRTTPLLKSAIPRQGPDDLDSKEELAKGKFLVASRRLRDPNFKETVVLLIDYGLDGAMGLVINRPSEVKLATVFPDIKELKERKDTIYVGGPVAVNQMLLLVGSPQVPEESKEVTQDVYISSSWKVLERLMKNVAKDERFRIFAGYAGWAPNQLDFERSRGDWYVLKADAETVFTQNPFELWMELIRRVTAKWVRTENLRKNLKGKTGPRQNKTVMQRSRPININSRNRSEIQWNSGVTWR